MTEHLAHHQLFLPPVPLLLGGGVVHLLPGLLFTNGLQLCLVVVHSCLVLPSLLDALVYFGQVGREVLDHSLVDVVQLGVLELESLIGFLEEVLVYGLACTLVVVDDPLVLWVGVLDPPPVAPPHGRTVVGVLLQGLEGQTVDVEALLEYYVLHSL